MSTSTVRQFQGIGSQLLNAGTNVATAFLAAQLLAPDRFGTFVIGFAGVSIALALGRGLIGSTMLAHLPSVERGGARTPLVRSAFGFAAVVGVLGAAVMAVASVWVPDLVWFVPWVIPALLHDVARYTFLATDRRGRALTLDVVWALVQGAVIGALVVTGIGLSVAVLAAAWGLGALGGLLAYPLLAPHWARPAFPGSWVATTRDVAGWFSATSVIGQVEVYLVLLLTGWLLTTADTGGLRAAQLLVFQPPMVLLGAVLGLATPAVARRGVGSPDLRRLWLRTAAMVAPVAVVVLLVAAAGGPLMRVLFPRFTEYTALVAPIALVSALITFCVPTLALLAGTRRARLEFRLHFLRTTAVAAAAAAGATLGGATGLAWALVVWAAAVLLMMTAVAGFVLRRTATVTVPAPRAPAAITLPTARATSDGS